MKEITSLSNSLIKQLKKMHDAKFRKKSGLCVVEGTRACEEFLNSSYELVYLLTQQKKLSLNASIDEDKLILVSQEIMNAISQATTPSGVLGLFKIPEIKKPVQLSQGVVLAQIQDPGNMGTLIRTAVACKVPSIIVVEGVDVWSYKVIQASAGSVAHANIFIMSWTDLVAYKKLVPLCALVVSGGKKPQEINLKKQLLVVGNEAHGLPDEWLSNCAHQLTLPMPGGTESLNAAVAGSLAMYIGYVL